jgi:Zinc-binding dehydrogenase
MALARGAHVIAAVRGDLAEARRLGAAEVYDTGARDVADLLRESHPDGVDAVLDIVNGRSAIRGDVEFLRPGGRLVSTVFGADVGWFAERHIRAFNIVGHTTPFGGTPNPKQSRQGLTEVAHMLAAGTITAHRLCGRAGRCARCARETPRRRPPREGRHPPAVTRTAGAPPDADSRSLANPCQCSQLADTPRASRTSSIGNGRCRPEPGLKESNEQPAGNSDRGPWRWARALERAGCHLGAPDPGRHPMGSEGSAGRP